jgi:hypothetical protein
MDINPADAAINECNLSGDECIMLECNLSDEGNACVLDLSNIFPILGSPSNTFVTILAAKAKIALDNWTGTSFDSIQVLVSLEESVMHHFDAISITAEQQEVNRKVLGNEFLSVLHTILMNYAPQEIVT